MSVMQSAFGLVGYGVTAIAYSIAAALVVRAHPGTRQADWLLTALVTSAVWAASMFAAIWTARNAALWVLAADALHAAVWVLMLGTLLDHAGYRILSLPRILKLGAVIVTALLALLISLSAADGAATAGSRFWLMLTLCLPLLGLFGIEQIYRNASFEQHRVLKPLAVGIGAIFAADIFVYSQAVLFGSIAIGPWMSRGLVNAAAAPLILLAVKRQPDWENKLFVSRQVVFYTTGLIGAGLYLVAMATGGYLVSSLGLSWGVVLEVLFFVSAAAVFIYALFSATVRRRIKVFIAKHFYRNRYDYREEWLRLMKTLANDHEHASLAERGLRALAGIVESPGGELWLLDKTGASYESYGAWRADPPQAALASDDSLVEFLQRSRWVVDTEECREDPEKYSNAFAADDPHLSKPSIYVPLMLEDGLVGIVRLDRPASIGALSFEDHDLLKTAGQQVAIFLAQERAKDELAQTRQFEAFSKLTAFLMHDLKNLIAQQELVVANARRFKHNPEFVDDAIRTIESSVARMRDVLSRLKGEASHVGTTRIELHKLLEEVCGICADRRPAPKLEAEPGELRVAMDRDKLAMAVTHAVRNAQDASVQDGLIKLRLRRDGEQAVIEVADEGVGMDAEFVRDRLFRPFDSTKGVKGMGIGAYQIRETLRAAGGDVEVRSTPGRGTSFRLILPLSGAAASRESSVV